MTALRRFLSLQSGAAAAEFAMVLPVALLFLFGTFDIGRYFWSINKLEKAVQAGTRFAVATAIVPGGLDSATYVGFSCPGGTLKAGDRICREALGTITCTKPSTTVSCTCAPSSVGSASCPSIGTIDTAAFNGIVHRMQVINRGIASNQVRIKYSGSGIGFAGDPRVDQSNAPLSEISPVVTVEISSFTFRSMSLLGYGLTLPDFRYSQTLEDGDGAWAY